MSNIGTKYILAERFTFDPNSNSLIDQENDSEMVRLGSNESRILLLLCERPNEVITRHELHEFVWRDQGFEVDDSSLTQAISTLRKMLKDSTKSPEFVKTVPKRGYQMIASISRSLPNSHKEPLVEQQESAEVEEFEADSIIVTGSPTPSEEFIPNATIPPNVKADKQKLTIRSKLMLVVAILLPILALLLTSPSHSKFRQLAVYNNIVVNTPINHPDLTNWLPSIEKCVKKYNKSHTGELAPKEVIATGGQNNQLVLNYIHSSEFSGENITLRILANQDDFTNVCK
ncbi:winged helix-turn-helix domain-containing protein [Vibrio aestuarianus]|uniref:Transcriptional regulator n=1 Tax=Vibrio aestuarianus TaxID=28171 RepID=A0A9X4EWN7_9VIBR|nr:transcriptional regulator [Vibrio aestuarianus]MDE1232691.1 transcriptional regulator [Vibrio aestuarianus]MDE1242807.1 transcriptional regulator [Vibrio aestuarianus]